MKKRPDHEEPGVSRRELLELTVLGGAALVATSACSTPNGEAGGQVDASSEAHPFELEEVTLSELADGFAEGRWSARQITEQYLQRIADLDRQGVSLQAVIETNPEALEIAERLDEERRQGQVRGPLHGVPILLKDNIATHDRNTTTAGSLALEGSISPADSAVAQRLREAGAVLLGKANLSEWANFRSSRSSSGWSGRGGQCKNPYVLDRNPCGSSSGSGAATSANFCAAAIGTETNGSIVCPSSNNGVVGVKPTVGLVSRSRIVPISHSQDTAGPMARTVRDAALVLSAIAGIDVDDPATKSAAAKLHPDYTVFLDPDGLRGARIGVARNTFGFHPDVDALMEEALTAMRDAGAELIDPVEPPVWADFEGAPYQVLLYEFKAGLAEYFAGLGEVAPVKSLADVIAFNEANAGRSMPYFGQELLIAAEEKGPLTEPAYLEALAKSHRVARAEGIDRLVAEHRLDAIVAPTGGPAWVTDLVNGDHFGGGSSTPAAVAGYPNVTVPAGQIHGLPVGMSIYGPAFSEPVLLRLAYAFEQLTQHRTAPKFLPTLALGIEPG